MVAVVVACEVESTSQTWVLEASTNLAEHSVRKVQVKVQVCYAIERGSQKSSTPYGLSVSSFPSV